MPKTKDKGVSLGPLADAFTALGVPFPGTKTAAETTAAQTLLRTGTPEEIAACWQAVAVGEYGDPNGYDQRKLSFCHLAHARFFENWRATQQGQYRAVKRAAAAPPRPPRNEPPPLPGPVVPASPEVRAEYDAIRQGKRMPPVRGDPGDFERKRAEALAAAARIGVAS